MNSKVELLSKYLVCLKGWYFSLAPLFHLSPCESPVNKNGKNVTVYNMESSVHQENVKNGKKYKKASKRVYKSTGNIQVFFLHSPSLLKLRYLKLFLFIIS